jgi:hypothetical protein
MKLVLQIAILLIILVIIVYYLRKKEGLCNASCDISGDCYGTDLSNCLIGKKSVKCTEPVPADPIKCIADFGTSVGDPLCCGQEGVLQDTKYVCPNTLKKCSNFKCGSAFGSCVSK